MKNKLAILLICVLIFSSFNFAAAKARCPTCNGKGEVDCPNCDGTGYIGEESVTSCSHCSGSGLLAPKIYMTGSPELIVQGDSINFTGKFDNKESFDINATVTLKRLGRSSTSQEIVFPADEDVFVNVVLSSAGVGGLTTLQIWQSLDVKVNAGEISCPYCDGIGTTSTSDSCPDCEGGTLVCPDCDGTGFVTESQLTILTGASDFSLATSGIIVGAVAVGAGATSFVLLRKRRVSEKSLRRRSSTEFQRWVLKKLGGKDAASKDIAIGIDGFSRLGDPIAIKQSDSVDMAAIDSFAAALAKSRARSGTMVAFGFGSDAIRGKVRARTNFKVNIELLTVQELIQRR